MGILILKLTLTPLLIGVASLAGRRWGSEIGGWLVGIPFTSGPIAFFLAVGPGLHFAADASVGILAGAVSIPTLPISLYPTLAPPQVTVTSNYVGANANVVESAVTIPLEQQINGVEGMHHMTSTSSNESAR